MQGQFFPNEAEFQGEGLPPAPHNEWPLANGELAFIQTYHGKFGPLRCKGSALNASSSASKRRVNMMTSKQSI